ncbi:MFS transporter [Paraburkholderia sediminicola]|uniref:MFS transporter n=1 Tax=Burkholderiaceae TaxID=119060 RepID=UPI0015A6A6D5|nr:MFS transporter [Burkholderia sp. WP9]
MNDINQRLDRLPIVGSHKWVIGIFMFAYFFELSDLSTFAYAAPQLIKNWGIHLHAIALITSASFGGMFVGALVGGVLGDRFGRKTVFVLSVLVYTVASFLNGFAWDIWSLAAFRLITGLGLSAMTVVASTYTIEFFPAQTRGRILSLIIAFSLVGIPITAWVARGLVTTGPEGWRYIFIWGALGILVVPAAIVKLNESPRWLERRGETERAQRIVARLETAAIARHGELPPFRADQQLYVPPKVSHAQIFGSEYRPRLIVFMLTSIFSTLGFYGFIAWVPSLLVEHGFSVVKSLSYSSLMAICNPLGALIAMTMIEKVERKYMIAGAALFIAVLVSMYGWTTNPVLIVAFGAAVMIGLQAITVAFWTFESESFPTDIRSGATGLIYGVGRMANIIGPFIVSGLYGAFGYYSVFMYIVTCFLIGGAIVAVFGPKSTGLSLESIGEAQTGAASKAMLDMKAVKTRGSL